MGSNGSIDDKRALSHLMDLLAIEGLSGREGKVAEASYESDKAVAFLSNARVTWVWGLPSSKGDDNVEVLFYGVEGGGHTGNPERDRRGEHGSPSTLDDPRDVPEADSVGGADTQVG